MTRTLPSKKAWGFRKHAKQTAPGKPWRGLFRLPHITIPPLSSLIRLKTKLSPAPLEILEHHGAALWRHARPGPTKHARATSRALTRQAIGERQLTPAPGAQKHRHQWRIQCPRRAREPVLGVRAHGSSPSSARRARSSASMATARAGVTSGARPCTVSAPQA